MRIFLSWVIVGWLLSPTESFAAAACGDPTAASTATPASATITQSYTTPSGSNQVLVAAVTIRHGTVTIDSATHAGNAMTAVAASVVESPMTTRIFRISNPTSGTNDVVVTNSGTPLATAIVVFTCSGIDTADPQRDQNVGNGTSTGATVTVSGAQSGDITIDMVGGDNQTAGPSEGANQTFLAKGSPGSEIGYGASYQTTTDGVMSWTMNSSDQWAIMAAVLKPSADLNFLMRRRTQ